MKIFTAFLRIALMLVWIQMLVISDLNTSSFEFFAWIATVITATYFMIMTQFWVESIWCPMAGCNIKK